ncbi:EAL domain-containing protein [Aquibacillus koreensis]|uniref:EAL domain-containing protein n=1 Tax=Aquibacillus koreensis TaxID=279446 RepID=A0A9X3WMI7_9BACI|nr:EAL domain-containing protein [Aquibacillus koreensis]MCT2535726.1 EAL domain-containing protein [Aquibacillus koreensis]MDC3419989.1 EAL domain-containing protein [Aquibacillus koreensis]
MFTPLNPEQYVRIEGEYDTTVVFLSILLACFASYTALSMNERMQQNSFFNKNIWLLLASAAMGFGIWSMHFVAMSAFHLPVMMSYNHVLTILSILPAFLASLLAFNFLNRPKSFLAFISSGVVMGIGISTMHYVGMASMEMEAEYVYDVKVFLTSVFIAIIVSIVSLIVFSSLQRFMANRLIKIVTSIIMGSAVASMHYTGMAGTSFYQKIDQMGNHESTHQMDMSLLIVSVSVGVGLLFVLLLLSSVLDRYIDYRVNYFDFLTKLPNGRHFQKVLSSSSTIQCLAVMELKNLEKINTDFGYEYGDEIIDYVANQLQQKNLPFSTIYKIDGSRFAISMNRLDQFPLLVRSMKAFAEHCKEAIFIINRNIKLEVVCALSTSAQAENAKSIYANTLAVINHHSITKQKQVTIFDPKIHMYSFERDIVEGIDRAMKNNDLFLVYQPKIGSESLQIVGFEALIRWKHPIHGNLSPVQFLPVLEQNERIFDVTDWVIEEVCKQIVKWHQAGYPIWQVSVNIPGDYVSSPRLLDTLKAMVQRYQLEPKYLELEMTETSFVKSIESAMRAISTFKKEGFMVALDDFGTGVSSLSYLRQMPISTLKIDKAFVEKIPESEKDASILKAISDLGRSLQLEIVIEGVETEEQVAYIQQLCPSVAYQGYYFSKPLAVDEVVKWIENHQAS